MQLRIDRATRPNMRSALERDRRAIEIQRRARRIDDGDCARPELRNLSKERRGQRRYRILKRYSGERNCDESKIAPVRIDHRDIQTILANVDADYGNAAGKLDP
jgi:hypothetical protein